jgi:L-2-hydroxyglutarate oxidase LhgO
MFAKNFERFESHVDDDVRAAAPHAAIAGVSSPTDRPGIPDPGTQPLMDILVIGAGVVGLASARALARRGHSVIVAEATGGIGNGISSRNSEVIHAGMYYPAGSLRARHCVAGRRMLYAYCQSHGVAHRKCGKLIVATNDLERAKIDGIFQQGVANGVEGLRLISGEEARALEPNLSCIAAVLSEETGIVDSHALMLALQGDLEERGGMIAFNSSDRAA